MTHDNGPRFGFKESLSVSVNSHILRYFNFQFGSFRKILLYWCKIGSTLRPLKILASLKQNLKKGSYIHYLLDVILVSYTAIEGSISFELSCKYFFWQISLLFPMSVLRTIVLIPHPPPKMYLHGNLNNIAPQKLYSWTMWHRVGSAFNGATLSSSKIWILKEKKDEKKNNVINFQLQPFIYLKSLLKNCFSNSLFRTTLSSSTPELV